MAGFGTVAAVALSIREQLNRWFTALDEADEDAFRALPVARMVQTDDFSRINADAENPIKPPTLSVFVWRVDINRVTRTPWAAVAAQDRTVHLPLDVHLLLTAWDSDIENELRMIGATMQCLEAQPVLAGPRLHSSGGWQPGEAVQIVNESLATEDVLRTFETLPVDYRLSVAYLARVARIDAPVEPDHPDVVAAVRGLVPSAERLP
jgi:Pvc16 N-terminal domain